MRNDVKVFLLMASLAALLGAIGQLAAGVTGFAFALALAAVTNVAMTHWSTTLVPRRYGACVGTAADAPQHHAIVGGLPRAGVPMPAVAIAHEPAHILRRDPTHPGTTERVRRLETFAATLLLKLRVT